MATSGTKLCTKCCTEKGKSLFYNHTRTKDKKDYYCKVCRSAINRKYAVEHPDKMYDYNKKWLDKNPHKKIEFRTTFYYKDIEKSRETNRLAYQRNLLARRNSAKKYREKYPHLSSEQNMKRYASKTNAVPSWVGVEEKFLIQEAYHLSRLRTKQFGFQWHVDHIVPLRSKLVCGLHCIDNLQVIPAITNMKKSNKHQIESLNF